MYKFGKLLPGSGNGISESGKNFSDYKYFSFFSESWLKHCKEHVEMIIPRLGLKSDSMVVEVACDFLPENIEFSRYTGTYLSTKFEQVIS